MKKILLAVAAFTFLTQSKATNYMQLHGFDTAHDSGLMGENNHIAVFNDPIDTTHPIFEESVSRDLVKMYDVGSGPYLGVGEDVSKDQRYPDNLGKRMLFDFPININMLHGNHICGLLTGKQGRYNEGFFSGGVTPEANIHIFHFPRVGPSLYCRTGKNEYISALSIQDLIDHNMYDSDYIPNEHYLEVAERPTLHTYTHNIIDTGILNAFQACSENPNISVINCSFSFGILANPLNNYKVSEESLNIIGDALEQGDQTLVVSANNRSGINLSDKNCTECKYFSQFAKHPKISPRLIIAINIQEDNPSSLQKTHFPRTQIHLADGNNHDISIYYSSNIPGITLSNYAVSAFGSDILSGWSRHGLQRQSGTSEAAPLIAGACALLKQQNPSWNSIDITSFVKGSVSPVDPELQRYYGLGVLNVMSSLDQT